MASAATSVGFALRIFLCIVHDAEMVCSMFLASFLKFYLFILAALGLLGCARTSSGCSEWELLFVVMLRAVLQVASLAVRRKL